MSNPLEDIIKSKIRDHGPISVAEYMGLCLGHPDHGYYMTRDPFGARGDFITAPEVSQMFGEMVGVWIADLWIKMGRPSSFVLLECGPGRGTLMADILRTTRGLDGFHKGMKLCLMEISPTLKSLQKQNLDGYAPCWIADVSEVPQGIPVILVANEFLDALPVHVLVKRGMDWCERQVDLADDAFHYVEKPVQDVLKNAIPHGLRSASDGGVYECPVILNQFIKSVGILLKKQTGVALFLDYGHPVSAMGETLQAMRSHRFVSPFDAPGESDLTVHVDFENVAMQAWAQDMIVHGPVTQRSFLQGLGIEVRAERLMTSASMTQKTQLASGLKRLIDTDQMGELFKVVAFCNDAEIKVEGFDEGL